MNPILFKLQTEVHKELVNGILPFWSQKMVDNQNGGFYGRIDGYDGLISDAEKGGILNARILWSFSSAFLHEKNPLYLEMAFRAKQYITTHFFDSRYGGTYWAVSFDGKPQDTKKQIYSQAFFIYAFSEHYRASGDQSSLQTAIELFRIIEKYSFDSESNGYFEAYSRDWKLLEDLRLSEKDANEKKTMNTHLHILEAYTNLYREWKDEGLRRQLRNLIQLFNKTIIDPTTYHLNLFFDENWTCKSVITSYGHDIEASWLLLEAAEVLGDGDLAETTKEICLQIVNAASEGLQADGSLIYEMDNATGHRDKDRHWWPQAEAVVGYLNAYKVTGKEEFLLNSLNCWKYIKENLVDKANGEWFWSIKEDGNVNRKDDKAGFWKCPYHNARMCLEVMSGEHSSSY